MAAPKPLYFMSWWHIRCTRSLVSAHPHGTCCFVRIPPSAFWRVVTEPVAPVTEEVPETAPVEQAIPTEPVAEAPVAAPVDPPLPGTMAVLEQAVGLQQQYLVPGLLHGARISCNTHNACAGIAIEEHEEHASALVKTRSCIVPFGR